MSSSSNSSSESDKSSESMVESWENWDTMEVGRRFRGEEDAVGAAVVVEVAVGPGLVVEAMLGWVVGTGSDTVVANGAGDAVPLGERDGVDEKLVAATAAATAAGGDTTVRGLVPLLRANGDGASTAAGRAVGAGARDTVEVDAIDGAGRAAATATGGCDGDRASASATGATIPLRGTGRRV